MSEKRGFNPTEASVCTIRDVKGKGAEVRYYIIPGERELLRVEDNGGRKVSRVSDSDERFLTKPWWGERT